MKIFKVLFVVLFLACISLPLVFLDTNSIVSEQENRNLAAFPQFIENGGTIIDIKEFPRSFDAYINDHFGFRNTVISWSNTLNRMSKTINGNDIFGKDGWLFYSRSDDGNNISDYFKINLFTDAEIKQFIANIEERFDWCARNNIKFVLLIAPNKHNVYPEYYPFERPDGITRTGQIMAALPDRLKDAVIYPLDYIVQNKTNTTLLYYERDTHWNTAGAYYAFELLFSHIKKIFPNTDFPEIQNMPPMNWEHYYHYIKNDERNGIITQNSDKTLPKAIIYRDSFFTALEPFTSTIFSEVEYNWRRFVSVEKEYVLSKKPDIIIWELVERYSAVIPDSKWN